MYKIWNNIDVSPKKIREFGLVIFIVVGLIIPVIIFYKYGFDISNTVIVLFASGTLFFGATLLLYSVMTPVYRVWMLLALGMGFVMTRIIISLVYIILITPIGLIRRVWGSETPKNIRNFKKSDTESYWIARDDPYRSESTERQF
jgi:Na+-transporting methylmalonyl-CoA/oxaloacetate decarboxylase gamma subunit